jgi:uncharacterized membrane protein
LFTIAAAISDSSMLAPLKTRLKDVIWITVILSAAWPIAVLTFGLMLMMLSRLRTPPSLVALIPSMCAGALLASLCVWAAVRVLTKTWRAVIFSYLLLAGVPAVLISTAVFNIASAHPFRKLPSLDPSRLFLDVLVVLGSALYGHLFGLALRQGGRPGGKLVVP